MSMICCIRCSEAVDSDYKPEIFREGWKLMPGHLGVVKTDNPRDAEPICDGCCEIMGIEEE